MNWLLSVLQLLMLTVFYVLDIRDLWLKLIWLGPTDSFSFETSSTTSIAYNDPLVSPLMKNRPTSGQELERLTGWTSYYALCETLFAPAKTFHTFIGRDCRLGLPSKSYIAPEVLFSANVRVDAIAYVSCKLLFLHRRPPLCQEPLVTDFSQRYRLWDKPMKPTEITPINSDAEKELIQMLDLLSRSYPLTDVICTEAFQPSGAGVYEPNLFACASPNRFETAVVGFYATSFAIFHRELAWLTVDTLQLMGLEFVIRQNAQSNFMLVVDTTAQQQIKVTDRTSINFASFGHLYGIMALVDLSLFVVTARSAKELIRALGWPLSHYTQSNEGSEDHFTSNYSWILLYRSLYRSTPIVMLTILSGFLSWMTTLPLCSAWAWTDQTIGGVDGLLSAIRIWMMVICLLNFLWDAIASMSERLAYTITTKTFVSTLEVLLLSAFVVYAERATAASIATSKHTHEHQRVLDNEAFTGRVAFANSYNEDLDYHLGTSWMTLHSIYMPLFQLLGESLLLIGVYLVIKLIYFRIRMPQDMSTESGVAPVDSIDDLDITPLVASDPVYHRLMLEELLHVPIRACSLVREEFQMEETINNQLYLRPQIYLFFGVICGEGNIRTRRGFPNVLHLKVDVAKCFFPNLTPMSTKPQSPSPSRAETIGVVELNPASANILSDSLSDHSGLNTIVMNDVLDTDDALPPMRRPLGETKNSALSKSMRRRKSTNELTSLM